MRARGLTLLELIVCFSLALLLIIFVLNLFPGSLLALRHSEQRLEAQRQAERLLDQARQARFDTYSLDTPVTLGPTGLNGTLFQPVLEVKGVAGYDPALVREYRLSLSWDDHGTPRNCLVSAVFSRGR